MRDDTFQAEWGVDDGYTGRARPQSALITASDIEEDMSEVELRHLFQDAIRSDFEEKVSWYSPDEDRFVEWARTIIQARAAEDADAS